MNEGVRVFCSTLGTLLYKGAVFLAAISGGAYAVSLAVGAVGAVPVCLIAAAVAGGLLVHVGHVTAHRLRGAAER
jgi:hypothetical protein